ncbi:MAG: putative sugar O-methyltransferase [Cohaesibacteraceae bacterium]|nr:putative sugar O-methyltransferase [Cohaesibacteraceae bacterium]MBL4876534.1 putative sugar O-methyltransferase [Cohaesibacteraceae bacterium]
MSNGSKLWNVLTSGTFSNINDQFISDFRMPGSTNKFVAWDPYEKSTRYLKFLLFTMAQAQSAMFLEKYNKISCVDQGEPISVKFGGCEINSDYFAAIEEFEFLENAKPLFVSDIKHVVEIGAGFGRTCHSFLTLLPNLEKYSIIDLEPMLALSSAYLKKVAPEHFDRIQFITSDDHKQQSSLSADLAINIDSFQEMPMSVIDGYMERVINNSDFFYSKNAVGKYLPETIGMPELSPDKLLDVFELGRCQDVIDIFDDRALQMARNDCLKAYKPDGREWHLVNDMPMLMFPYFHHALYSC